MRATTGGCPYGQNMKYNPEIHHRKSIRLKHYDYAEMGTYFITICTHECACLFGEIIDGEMRLNEAGRMIQSVWNELHGHFPNLELDAFIIMPNHVHGILIIADGVNVGAGFPRPNMLTQQGGVGFGKGGETPPLRCPSLGKILAYFKYQSTKRINELRGSHGTPVWQRNYYEQIVRDESECDRIREYIETNPARWAEDNENTKEGSQLVMKGYLRSKI